ncbi:hypothetical protein DPMN_120459 [Dreissena polymorpha]|uniref:Uncharacterized protein n=1 Tax=Dreissena polymorpha TaxID=45954 RepID=A0A9D4JQ61_DREPO|nr:hypothetical protein DPMN_120459 [Dreissena polymorpha]
MIQNQLTWECRSKQQDPWGQGHPVVDPVLVSLPTFPSPGDLSRGGDQTLHHPRKKTRSCHSEMEKKVL